MKKYQVLFITHRGERHQNEALSAAPSEFEITMLRSPSKDEILSHLPGKDFLITERSGVIDEDMIRAGQNLKLIQRLGSLTHDIDLEAAKKAGIPVSYLPVKSCILVAEHMIMQILSLSKRLPEMMAITASANDYGATPKVCDEDYFAYNWANVKDIKGIWGSTVGILGFGEIGAEVARRLNGYGCTILYNKRSPLPTFAEEELNIQFVSKEELLKLSDTVCMLLPFFTETAQSLDSAFFSAMKPGSLFVSCGGSGVVDEHALTEALTNGHLYGAALDTFTMEPISPENPLLKLVDNPKINLILTPHTAAGTPYTQPELNETRTADYINLKRITQGEKISGRVV
ncbi:MAG: hypothetical protein CL609_02795 [Anaerolineaceae bacterium]|nr:hypothetical protein [Anaerolineaceae bacterium]